jgi:hypothetical protein
MSRLAKITLFYVCIAIVLLDAYVLVARLLTVKPPEVDFVKVTVAALFQVTLILITAPYVAFMARRMDKTSDGGRSSWAKQFWFAPVIAFVIVAAFSFNLMFNAFVCGDLPFPRPKNIPMCSR